MMVLAAVAQTRPKDVVRFDKTVMDLAKGDSTKATMAGQILVPLSVVSEVSHITNDLHSTTLLIVSTKHLHIIQKGGRVGADTRKACLHSIIPPVH